MLLLLLPFHIKINSPLPRTSKLCTDQTGPRRCRPWTQADYRSTERTCGTKPRMDKEKHE